MNIAGIFNFCLILLSIIGLIESTWLHASLVLFPEREISNYLFLEIRLFAVYILLTVTYEMYLKFSEDEHEVTERKSKRSAFQDNPKWVNNLLGAIAILGSVNCFFCLFMRASSIFIDIEPDSVLGDSQYWQERMATGAFMLFYGFAAVTSYSYFLIYHRRRK